MDLYQMTAVEIGRKIKQKEISAVEATEYALGQIQKQEGSLNAFITLLEEDAMQSARAIQKKIDAGEDVSPLAGVPMAIKDNICTKGIKTTCGSKMLHNFVPPYDARAVEKLKDGGAVILGKLNMDEFAMGGSTETSYFGPTKNPWNTEYVPGGSSGGSAVAVSGGEAFYTLGSDTGGSIRQPCSFCSVSGIKPTYGAVSRYGLVAFASSLDQIGPMGKTIEDCATVLHMISGHDKKDATSLNQPPIDFSKSFCNDVKGLKVGIPKNYFADGLDLEVKDSVLEAAKTLEGLGAVIEEFELPVVEYAIPSYYIVACAEASSNLSRYDGIKYGFRSESADNITDVFCNSRSEGFGIEVKRRIMLGSFVLSAGYYDAYYKKALQVRGLIQKSFQEAFTKYDLILCPNSPSTAFKIGQNISDPLKMYLGDIYTVAVNLVGLPAVAVPCGFSKTGLPIGLQLIGKPFSEPLLVRAAHTFQINTDFHTKFPAALPKEEE